MSLFGLHPLLRSRRWLGVVCPLLIFALAVHAPSAHAQADSERAPTAASPSKRYPRYVRIPYVLLTDSVRAWFAAHWDDTSRTQKEVGGCLTYRRQVTRMGDTLYWVTSATLVKPEYASERALFFECPKRSARWHSHTPTTCRSDGWGNVDYSSCVIGGVDAYSCQASSEDRARLSAVDAPFGLIHCDRWALVPYFPARASP